MQFWVWDSSTVDWRRTECPVLSREHVHASRRDAPSDLFTRRRAPSVGCDGATPASLALFSHPDICVRGAAQEGRCWCSSEHVRTRLHNQRALNWTSSLMVFQTGLAACADDGFDRASESTDQREQSTDQGWEWKMQVFAWQMCFLWPGGHSLLCPAFEGIIWAVGGAVVCLFGFFPDRLSASEFADVTGFFFFSSSEAWQRDGWTTGPEAVPPLYSRATERLWTPQ